MVEHPNSTEPSRPSVAHGFWRWFSSQRENLQTIVLAVFLALFIRSFVAEARYIPSGSMEPTLRIDDRLIVEKLSYEFQQPERGQVIVFTPPKRTNIDQAFIKRVIGLPGDTIEVKNGKVLLNGRTLNEPYIATPPAYILPRQKVPAGHFFVMGDNRNNSFDSHLWGFLPRQNVIGRAVFRFWPLERVGAIE
ncbi:signal peptidase I [Gloeobacter violaceus]|uniref:Signal peptidase I n=1 Tax=Gloeobacter violaceus (strain ATCC 29082 / PCC 7421) TaxID=251221 RepID=Q7NJ09_GLOVI|nr:signal peptidase I [Gloeobacter violaceus]BAC89964.1 signal peptidase I [Gloeobacter violaceus PCC 7421]